MIQDSTCSNVFSGALGGDLTGWQQVRWKETLGSQSKQQPPWSSSFAAPFLSDFGWVTKFFWSVFSSNKGFGLYQLFSKFKKGSFCLFVSEKPHQDVNKLEGSQHNLSPVLFSKNHHPGRSDDLSALLSRSLWVACLSR